MLFRHLIDVKCKAQGKLLDVGCGAKPYSLLFLPQVDQYVGVDLPSSAHGASEVDVYGNAMALPFQSSSFDTVLCTEVLEHVPEPQKVVHELSRVLKGGGHLLLTAPQNYWVHEAPGDFYRFTRYGLSYLVSEGGLEIDSMTPTCGVSAYFVDSVSKLVIVIVNQLDLPLAKLFRRPKVNLLRYPVVRLLIAFPQWIYVWCYFTALRLAKAYAGLAPVEALLRSSSERFSLGHLLVATKR
jgi:SAM-dependent methyltransferase